MKKQDINLVAYETDASMIEGNALKVEFPQTIEKVRQIVTMNNNLVVRGAGTGLAGGCVPQNSVVLSLEKMNKILNLDAGKKIVEAEAGIILDELNNYLEKYNLEFPVKPSSHEVCTIGGMIATNAVGNRAVKYGRTSDWISELEVVNGKGEILKIGKTELNDFSGMEGITGVIVRAKLKLATRKQRTSTLFSFSEIKEAIENTIKFKLRNDVCAIEFFDRLSSSLLGLPEAYHLLVEFESDDGKLKGSDYEKIMQKRDGLYPVLAKLGYTRIEDPKILLNRFEELADLLESGKIPYFGHLGSGIIHPVFRQNEEDKVRKMLDYVKKLHGQISGEHGIGLRKKEFLDASDKKLIRIVKKRHDPLCKLNCSKVIDCEEEKTENEVAAGRVEQAARLIEEQNRRAEQEKIEQAILEESNDGKIS